MKVFFFYYYLHRLTPFTARLRPSRPFALARPRVVTAPTPLPRHSPRGPLRQGTLDPQLLSPTRKHRGIRPRPRARASLAALTLLSALSIVIAGCGSASTGSETAGSTALNHTHDLLVLRGAPSSILLATHYGLYRSGDAGKNWTEVAGGAGQSMDGLMIYKLAQSPVDARRIYTLAIRRDAATPPAQQGIYTSADSGVHWQLATALTVFPNAAVYTLSAGAQGPTQLFAIDSTQGARGLYESDDTGAHWHSLPAVPSNDPSGLLADPTHPTHMLLWSRSTGLYRSVDAGQSWSPIAGVAGGVYSVTQAGAMVYAPGDAGLYASSDGGVTFRLADQQDTFSSVVASDSAPLQAYALGGTTAYTTVSGGSTWQATAAPPQHPGALTVDPSNPQIAYVAFSYPVGVAKTTDGGKHWESVFP